MAPKKSTRVVTTTSSRHTLSVGPLRHTPIGSMTAEQLESARQLVDAALQKAVDAGDDVTKKRLAADVRQLNTELERREFSAA